MHQANWMSLGIIVTLFACMAQRFVSSISLTKYASAASCRHNMACTWKHRSYLSTSTAISWTSHEKGLFQMRSSMLLWKRQILWRATVPSQYLWGFFSGAAHKNSFQRALSPTVGWSFLWAGFSLPDIDGPASTAIWANCWVVDDSGTSPPPPAILPPWTSSSSLPGPAVVLVLELGVHWCEGFLRLGMYLCPGPHLPWSILFTLVGCYFSSCHAGM